MLSIFQHTARRIGRWWSGGSPPEPPRPTARADETGQAPRLSPFDAAIAALQAMPDHGAGRLRVIALTDFRIAVGDKWPRLIDKVGMIADALIRRRIGPGNLFRREDPETWLLAFLDATPEQARKLAVGAADDISRHLLGERCVAGERPLAAAAHLRVDQAFDPQGRLDRRALQDAVDEGRSLFAHLSPCAPADVETDALELGRPIRRRHKKAAAWQPIVIDRKDDAPDEPWQQVGPLPAEARLSLLWRPTWVAQGEAISAYVARVIRMDHPDAPPLEGPMAYPVDDAVTAFAIDRFVAAAALRDLRNANARSGSVIIPLTWSSLVGDKRAELVAPFADLPEEVRRRKVSVEICRIPDDCDPRQVIAVLDFVGSLCGDCLLRLRLSSPLLCRIDALGGARIGLDLAELRPRERMSDDNLLEVLDRLQSAAESAGSSCYLWSARRRKVVGEAVDGGFDMVNGPGLMKDVGRPALVMPAPRRRFTGE